jgi:hypothetical protein
LQSIAERLRFLTLPFKGVGGISFSSEVEKENEDEDEREDEDEE